MSNAATTEHYVTAHCADGTQRTIRSQDVDAIRATIAYWSGWRCMSWIDSIETNVRTRPPVDAA